MGVLLALSNGRKLLYAERGYRRADLAVVPFVNMEVLVGKCGAPLGFS